MIKPFDRPFFGGCPATSIGVVGAPGGAPNAEARDLRLWLGRRRGLELGRLELGRLVGVAHAGDPPEMSGGSVRCPPRSHDDASRRPVPEEAAATGTTPHCRPARVGAVAYPRRVHVVISGASGLIGTALATQLRVDGHQVTALVRRQAGADELRWDPAAGQIPAGALDGVDAVVNLAGAGINDHRWSDDYKRVLVASRVSSTELLAATIAHPARRPDCSSPDRRSATTATPATTCSTRSRPPGDDFLARSPALGSGDGAARSATTKVALIRTGIVLTPKGGALRKQLPLFKLGLGGKFGDGQQWQSWISLDDEVAAIAYLLANPADGAFNLTAPNPVRNVEMTKALGEALHRPTVLPIPMFAPAAAARRRAGRRAADDQPARRAHRLAAARVTSSSIRSCVARCAPLLSSP